MTQPQASHRPATIWQAMLRGARFRCPRCEAKGLFPRFLKPAPRCASCGQDWSLHKADDFPPYISIFVTGHVMAPVIIEVSRQPALALWIKLAICLVLGSSLMLALLQPAKGAVIALQWWMGMHGFHPAGRDEAASDPA